MKKIKCVESRNEPSFQGEKSLCHMSNELITQVDQKHNYGGKRHQLKKEVKNLVSTTESESES